ncbi:major facilitator superfamily domain-containing protein 6-like [Corythoichthys intestinalis]|uniref:major facilitator superfamily domain-containing protein 6-like n=1 Tax=Corythoichthys intestinalis TaxID=161448 RepID=UPI0025A4EA69|nr:major facilitator superfamily domain-containing protein 6-like [Corythoichthys intestinalis]XP_057717536.1 major facilitator superfamily domain-containing protein 6-like [Corythoichthys intestinalis]XP_061805287.1 major facilitator superfamily domain-containing protein 6-like [Nerophis lumbriciformis]
MKKTKQINIKRTLALARAFHFLYSCAKSCLLPFVTLYFRQLGLTPEMTGIVMGTKHLISLVWRPLGTQLAKMYNKRRVVLHGSLVCSAVVALVMLLVPPVDLQAHNNTCNGSNLISTPSPTESQPNVSTAPASQSTVNFSDAVVRTSHLPVTTKSTAEPKNKSFVVFNSTSLRKKRSQVKPNTEKNKEEGQQDFLSSLKMMDVQRQLFFLILITVSVWELVAAPLEWTADDGLYDYLDFADASDHYSSTGLCPVLGAAFGVAGSGLLVSQLNCFIVGHTSRSIVHFLCYAGVSALALPVAAFLPLYLNKQRVTANRLIKAVQLMHGSRRATLCAVTALLVGMTRSTVDNFLTWQMQDHHSTELHMGVSLGLASLSQAAFAFLAVRLTRLLSSGRLLTLGAAALGLQCLYYSFLWGPWAALPVQLLSSFSCGAFWWAVKVQSDDVATPGTERSIRRLYNALSLDLGSALGSFAGGFAVRWFGLVWLFRGVAAALILWCSCLPLLQWNAPHQYRINYSRLLAADGSETSDSESEQERDWLDKAMEDDHCNNNTYGRGLNH